MQMQKILRQWEGFKKTKKNIAAYETFSISYLSYEKDISNADGVPFNELSRFPATLGLHKSLNKVI